MHSLHGIWESGMRILLFVLASTAAFAVMNPAAAQYTAYPAGPYGWGPPPPPPPASDWREQRLNNGWGADAGQQPQRSQQPQQLSPNNATTGFGLTNPNAEGGECAKGMSEETCRRRGEKYNPSPQN